jgi:hypothetical protein
MMPRTYQTQCVSILCGETHKRGAHINYKYEGTSGVERGREKEEALYNPATERCRYNGTM